MCIILKFPMWRKVQRKGAKIAHVIILGSALLTFFSITTTKVFIFPRYVFIHFVCTFNIDILGNKADLELYTGLAWQKFIKLHHATFVDKLALYL